MKKSIFSICLLIVSVTFFSCTKDVTELPAATEIGANTFGCKINDNFWVPAGFGIIPTASILEARFLGDDLIINARNFSSSPKETEFEIYIKVATAPGTYMLNTTVSYPSSTASYAYYVRRHFTPDNEWITSAQYTGFVTITKVDKTSGFVSGTFEFQALNMYDAPQPVSVTEGRFDVKTQ